LPIYTDKRSGRYYIQFDFQGQTYKRRLPSDTSKELAEALEGKLKSDLLLESFGIEQKKDIDLTAFLAEHFLPFAETHYSVEGYKGVIVICKDLAKFLHGKTIRKISAADIDRYKTYRQSLKTQHKTIRTPGTIHRELSIVSKIFSVAIKNEFLEFNPCSRVERPIINNLQDKIIPKDKLDEFIKAIKSPVARDVAVLILNTGLRQNDALGLKKENVDFNEKTITLIQGKSKRVVHIPLNDTVLEILEKRKDFHATLFFPNPKTKQQIKSIKKALATAGTATKLGKIGTRVLRRTFATLLDEMNFSPTVVARLLGHSDLRMVMKYKRGTDILRGAVDALNSPKSNVILPTAENEKQ
jgi:integrase